MTSKRARPYEEPPSPESSGEEDEDEEEEEQTPDQTPDQTPSNQQHESDEGEDDEDQEEDHDESSDDIKNPVLTPKTPAESKKKLPESKSESDSETDSDTDAHRSHKASNYTIKPVVNESKSASKAVYLKEKTNEEKAVKVSKPEKAAKTQHPVVEEDEDGVEKKGAINRLWSFTDEIAVLQGMIDFKKENNKDPGMNQDDFYNFVKVKLSNGKFTKVQVMDKVRRLKKKYKNNLNKSSGGKDPEISNPHELKSFQLSKKIWGDVDGNNIAQVHAISNSNSNSHVKANVAENVVNSSNIKNSGSSAKKSKILEKVAHTEENMIKFDEENKGIVGKDESKGEEKDYGQLYPHLMRAFEGESMPRLPLLDGLESCLSKVDSSQLEEWDRKWKKVRLAETEAYISRLALIQEQTSWFCDAMKSSKH